MMTILAQPPRTSANLRTQQTIIRLQFDRPVEMSRIQGKGIRGAIAGRFLEERLLHQHREDGSVEYRYPLVQYKRLGNEFLIVGLGCGAELVAGLSMVQEQFELEGVRCHLVSREMVARQVELTVSDRPVTYSFLTPWVALNEVNFARYQASGMAERQRLLERILIGNILSMSKGLGYVVTQEIKVSRLDVYPVRTPVRLKGVEMTGFKGTFAVNFDLPDLTGLGKSVSRGFGTVQRRGA
jgi:hypothetical protein